MLKQGNDVLHNAVDGLQKANRKFERQVDDICRDEQRKPPLAPPRPHELRDRISAAELQIAHAWEEHWKARYESERLLHEAAKAEQEGLRAKIEWLTRELGKRTRRARMRV